VKPSHRIAFGLLLASALGGAATGTAAAAAPDRPQIVGGRDATRPWPAMASVQVRQPGGRTSYCGGTLIAPSAVLTAAHCFDGPRTGTDVILGRRTLAERGGEVLRATAVDILGDYRPEGLSPPRNDLAVLRLAEPSRAAPQPIVAEGDAPLSDAGVMGTILGWGTTSQDGPFTRTIPLQEAQVPVVADPDCARAYGRAFEPATMVCAGYPQGGVDTCQGDSGGPLLVALGAGAFRLAGVTSWGAGCARPNRPGVYTRLQSPGLQRWLRARVALDGFSFSPAAPTAGERVTLRSTASSPAGGPAITGLAWDLDGDGGFDDATGTTATATLPGGQRSIRLEVTRGSARSTTESVVEVGSGAALAPLEQAPASPPPAAPAPAPAPAPPAAGPAPAPGPPAAPAPGLRPVPTTPGGATELTIALRVPGRGARRATLRCRPAGGTWAGRASVCARLARAGGASVLTRPLGATRGTRTVAPAALTITGTVAGRRVRLVLPARGSAAARRRYLEVRALLGPTAIDRAVRVLRRR
jgi:secreted trypsin-like serine protease